MFLASCVIPAIWSFAMMKKKDLKNVFTENLGDSYYGYSYNGLQEVRGCFIGDNFYLVGGGQIRIYDMANDYKEVGRLELDSGSSQKSVNGKLLSLKSAGDRI